MASTTRTAALSAYFEAGDLFVLAHIEGFASFDGAKRALIAGPRLFFADDRIFVACPGREAQLLFSDGYDSLDECGRWLPGANRSLREDGEASRLSMPALLALQPDAARFCIVWAAVQEWEQDANRRFIRSVASASGSIDTLAPGR